MEEDRKSGPNVLAWALIILLAIIIFLAIAGEKLFHSRPKCEEPGLSPEEIREIEAQMKELEARRDHILSNRKQTKIGLIYFREAKEWTNRVVNRTFRILRVALFLLITVNFLLGWIWFGTEYIDTSLRGLSIIGITLALLLFAVSEDNESIVAAYQRIKKFTVEKVLMYVCRRQGRKIGSELNPDQLFALNERHFSELVPIVTEIRELKRKL